jgi:hypothetical protein
LSQLPGRSAELSGWSRFAFFSADAGFSIRSEISEKKKSWPDYPIMALAKEVVGPPIYMTTQDGVVRAVQKRWTGMGAWAVWMGIRENYDKYIHFCEYQR